MLGNLRVLRQIGRLVPLLTAEARRLRAAPRSTARGVRGAAPSRAGLLEGRRAGSAAPSSSQGEEIDSLGGNGAEEERGTAPRESGGSDPAPLRVWDESRN